MSFFSFGSEDSSPAAAAAAGDSSISNPNTNASASDSSSSSSSSFWSFLDTVKSVGHELIDSAAHDLTEFKSSLATETAEILKEKQEKTKQEKENTAAAAPATVTATTDNPSVASSKSIESSIFALTEGLERLGDTLIKKTAAVFETAKQSNTSSTPIAAIGPVSMPVMAPSMPTLAQRIAVLQSDRATFAEDPVDTEPAASNGPSNSSPTHASTNSSSSATPSLSHSHSSTALSLMNYTQFQVQFNADYTTTYTPQFPSLLQIPHILTHYQSLVQENGLSIRKFWCRYFYRVYCCEWEENRRKRIAERLKEMHSVSASQGTSVGLGVSSQSIAASKAAVNADLGWDDDIETDAPVTEVKPEREVSKSPPTASSISREASATPASTTAAAAAPSISLPTVRTTTECSVIMAPSFAASIEALPLAPSSVPAAADSSLALTQNERTLSNSSSSSSFIAVSNPSEPNDFTPSPSPTAASDGLHKSTQPGDDWTDWE